MQTLKRFGETVWTLLIQSASKHILITKWNKWTYDQRKTDRCQFLPIAKHASQLGVMNSKAPIATTTTRITKTAH